MVACQVPGSGLGGVKLATVPLKVAPSVVVRSDTVTVPAGDVIVALAVSVMLAPPSSVTVVVIVYEPLWPYAWLPLIVKLPLLPLAVPPVAALPSPQSMLIV